MCYDGIPGTYVQGCNCCSSTKTFRAFQQHTNTQGRTIPQSISTLCRSLAIRCRTCDTRYQCIMPNNSNTHTDKARYQCSNGDSRRKTTAFQTRTQTHHKFHGAHCYTTCQKWSSSTLRHASHRVSRFFNPLNPELNPICSLLALLGAHHFLHISRIRVKLLTFRLLMSYIYGAPILDVSRSHTTTQHSR